MEFDPQDQDIINLLTRLKDTDAKYPEPMLVARRRSFLKQMTEVGLGIGTAAGIKSGLKKAKIPRISPFTGTVLETVLITAIVIETSAMAYFYREKLADFFQTIAATSKVEEVTPLPVMPTALEVQDVSPSLAVVSPIASATPITGPVVVMVTPTGTPVPGNTLEVNQSNSTPDPKGNNGNHYGQTPKPERTKENNGNNNKPPKENDKPPKEETKPPKDK